MAEPVEVTAGMTPLTGARKHAYGQKPGKADYKGERDPSKKDTRNQNSIKVIQGRAVLSAAQIYRDVEVDEALKLAVARGAKMEPFTYTRCLGCSTRSLSYKIHRADPPNSHVILLISRCANCGDIQRWEVKGYFTGEYKQRYDTEAISHRDTNRIKVLLWIQDDPNLDTPYFKAQLTEAESRNLIVNIFDDHDIPPPATTFTPGNSKSRSWNHIILGLRTPPGRCRSTVIRECARCFHRWGIDQNLIPVEPPHGPHLVGILCYLLGRYTTVSGYDCVYDFWTKGILAPEPSEIEKILRPDNPRRYRPPGKEE